MNGHVSAAGVKDRSDAPAGQSPLAARQARRVFVTVAALGFFGSVLIALSSPRLVDGGAISWWYSISFPFGANGNRAALYLGMGFLSAAWLALGFTLRTNGVTTRYEMFLVAAAWMAPLVISPAVFSRDVYSYLAQGAILHVGMDPYHHGPIVLSHTSFRHLADAVSPFWWRTPAPYGPLFLGIVSLIVGVTGSNLVAGVIVVRVFALAGVALVALFAPRLARLLGADPLRALWIGAMSPLAALELVLAGHNDALMAGLVLAGVTLAIEGRYRTGIALCAVAAVVKLPTLAAVVFLAIVWVRSEHSTKRRLGTFFEAGAITAVVIGGVSAATGVGLGWFSAAVLTVPGKVHLAITPVTQLGWTIGPVLRALGAQVSDRDVASGFGVAADIALIIFGALLLYRTRRTNVVVNLGVFFVAVALFGPAAWPWYFIWGLALLVCVVDFQQSIAVPALVVVSVFLVKPDGILALPVGSSPVVLAIYLMLSGGALVYFRRIRGRSRRAAVRAEATAAAD